MQQDDIFTKDTPEFPYKALFLDLDGTLLNDQKEITPGNKKAIDEALAAGNKITITTGRPLPSALKQAERLGLNTDGCYVISYNGGSLYDCGAKKVIFEETIPLDVVFRTFDHANRMHLHLQTYDHKHVVVEPQNEDPELHEYCDTILMEYRVIPEIRDLAESPVKMLAIDRKKTGILDEFQSWLAEKEGIVIDSFYSNEFYLEIVPKDMNKGNALLRLSNMLSIPVSHTIAAGDEFNDIPMIQAAGIGVAMKNGTDEARESADYITERDNNHDAIEEIIRKFVL